MRQCILLFSLSILFIFKAQASINPLNFEWNKGAIVLSSHDVITGEVSYSPSHDVVLYRSAGKIQTFSPEQIIYFHTINRQTGHVQRFVSLPHHSRLNFIYKKNYFFEVLLSGGVTFLRKTNKNRGFLQHAKRSDKLSRMSLDKICYDYYMLHGEELIPIKNFEKDALPLLTLEHAKNINNYIEQRNIKKFTPRNQLVVIHYYNSLNADNNRRLVQRMELSD